MRTFLCGVILVLIGDLPILSPRVATYYGIILLVGLLMSFLQDIRSMWK